MTTEGFAISSNTFGFIMGGITLLGLLISMARFHLPSNKIKVLESLLDETETFFKKAIEDGLLLKPSFVRETEQRLELLKRSTYRLQSRAYSSATSLSKDYAEFFGGTSTSIGRACQSLKKLRAEVVSSSEEGRRQLMEANSAPQHSLPFNSFPRVDNRHNLLSGAEINRPCSCPSSLTACNSDDSRSVASSDNPFSNPTQIGSGVQTLADLHRSKSMICTSANLELAA